MEPTFKHMIFLSQLMSAGYDVSRLDFISSFFYDCKGCDDHFAFKMTSPPGMTFIYLNVC